MANQYVSTVKNFIRNRIVNFLTCLEIANERITSDDSPIDVVYQRLARHEKKYIKKLKGKVYSTESSSTIAANVALDELDHRRPNNNDILVFHIYSLLLKHLLKCHMERYNKQEETEEEKTSDDRFDVDELQEYIIDNAAVLRRELTKNNQNVVAESLEKIFKNITDKFYIHDGSLSGDSFDSCGKLIFGQSHWNRRRNKCEESSCQKWYQTPAKKTKY